MRYTISKTNHFTFSSLNSGAVINEIIYLVIPYQHKNIRGSITTEGYRKKHNF